MENIARAAAAAADFRPARVYKAANRRTRPSEGRRRGGGNGGGGDDDNGERLLTKIEVVVMTGIARDEALRGDALSSARALASSEKKTKREGARGRERERAEEERERQLARGVCIRGGERGQGHAEESEMDRESQRARKTIIRKPNGRDISVTAVLKIVIIPGITAPRNCRFYLRGCARTRAIQFLRRLLNIARGSHLDVRFVPPAVSGCENLYRALHVVGIEHKRRVESHGGELP